ncbi:hypothetical protein FRB95_002499 [Tulasnella sp. JGI-2019a]|nr:hypothetical protein FRB95_002499 [Tulasnella sp. JGI-2019a]
MYSFTTTTSLAAALSLLSSVSATHIHSKHESMPSGGINLIYPADGVDSGISFPVGMKFDYADHVMGVLFFAQYEIIRPDGSVEVLTSYNNVIVNASVPDSSITGPFTRDYPFWNGTRSELTEWCHMFNNYEVSTMVRPTNMTGIYKVKWEMAIGTPSYIDRVNPMLCNGTYELQRMMDERSFNVSEAKTERLNQMAAKTIVAASVQPTSFVDTEPPHGSGASVAGVSVGILGVGAGIAFAAVSMLF